MPNLSKGLKQAYDLQDLAFELAMKSKLGMTDEELDQARTVAQLIRAWSEAQERVRIHRGKPLPGTLRPVSKPKHSKSRAEPEPATPLQGKASD